MSQLCGPVWRKSNSAAIGTPVASDRARFAAIGAWRLAGKESSADVTNTGSGRMRVRIESALMPGSNTPNPPGSQIQAWPGCQTRTSSFQMICTDEMRRGASQLRAGRDGCRFDQGIELADAGAGRLLQHHMLAGGERACRLLAPHLRRRAQHHRIDRRAVAQEIFERCEMRHIRQ